MSIIIKNKKIVVIGAGVIGSSWASLFLVNGMKVVINDKKDNIESEVNNYLKKAFINLKSLGYAFDENEVLKNLFFEKDLSKAVFNADFIQENGPERREFKTDLWSDIENYTSDNTLYFSSSSGITATLQSSKLKKPERLIIGHPFNPPHLIPLVEVVPGEKTSNETIEKSMNFYKELGKAPVLVKKEIDGFVANRLQSAIFRECVYLVSKGIVNAGDLDTIVNNSLGIRWAVSGPFLSFCFGGGQGGMRHFLEHLAPGMEVAWKSQISNHVTFDDKTKKLILEQIDSTYGVDTNSLEDFYDDKRIEVIKTLNSSSK